MNAVQEAAFARPNEALLVSALRSSADLQLSLVAEVDGEIVGHVFFSPVELDSPGGFPPCCGLAPIGVHPSQQGRGVGSSLIRSGLQQCARLGWRAVFLVGNPAYYSRFGFALAAPMGLRYGSEALDSVFQVLELESGALRACSGWVRYDRAFEQTGAA